ncbi:recQ-mediated genome instability protein 1-like [Sycon ciliatum]|uniref:recQ-mediated genome instability protein 1-like n=1 Tax=Sycon ciliatum TaxID=27933 RepID=UPI0031F691C9
MAHLNDAVKSYLRSSQKFCFHDQWLEDCIDWAKESFGEQASSARGLQDLVREQWLLGDLRDISPGCLPAWLPQSQVGVLSGTYALQVNQAVDVGASAYSQLEKLKGKEIIEEEQNDNKPSKKGWEEKPKASRLLMLELTDGIHTVRGMEHHPIPCLSTAISPGCKISISGTVRVRQGTLLLQGSNVSVLGGQVDGLEEEREQKRVLAGILGLDPAQQQQQQQQNASNALQRQGAASSSTAQSSTAQPSHGIGQSATNQSSTRGSGVGDEDIDAEDMEVLEQQIAEELDQITARGSSSSSARDHDTSRAVTARASSHGPSTSGAARNSTALDRQGARSVGQSTASAPLPLADRLRHPKAAVVSSAQSTISSSSNSRRTAYNHDTAVASLDDEEAELALAMAAEADFAANQPSPQRALSSTTRSRLTATAAGVKRESPASHQQRKAVSASASTTLGQSPWATPESSSVSRKVPSPITSKVVKTEALASSLSSSSTGASKHTTTPSRPSTALSTSSSGLKRFSKSGMSTSTPAAKRPCTSVSPMDEHPFIYLKTINDNLPMFANKSVWVKAFLGTLTSKLRNTDGWCVRAILNDGSSTMEVEFGNEILVKLIGFTTVEQKALYAQAKQMKSPAIKSRVLEGIQRCQRVLASLSCFLEISIALEREYPLVTQMREASSRDAEILLDNIRARLPNM